MIFSFLLSFIILAVKLIAGVLSLSGVITLKEYYLYVNPCLSLILYFVFRLFIERRFLRFALLTIDFFIPVFGPLTAIFALVGGKQFTKFQREPEQDSESFYLKEFEEAMFTKHAALEIQSEKQKEHGNIIEPYLDILQGSNTDLKIDACIKLSQFQNPEAITLLKIALKDGEYEVRYMANNALGKIEKKFMLEIDQINSIIEKFPNSFENLLARGDLYVKYYRSGALDEVISQSFLKRALKDFQSALSLSPMVTQVHLRLCYILAQLNNYDQLKTIVDEALGLTKDPSEINKFKFYLCEYYFHKHQFMLMQMHMHTINLEHIDYNKISDSVLFWRDIYE